MRKIVPTASVQDMFIADSDEFRARREIGRSLRPARQTIVIYFTPRSGSSWLSSVLDSSGQLGTGLELYNPEFISSISAHFGATSLEQYIELAPRFVCKGGVMSFEITAHQINGVFQEPEDFFRVYGNCKSVWLIREDIVLQAVSLAKMVRVHVSHSTLMPPLEIKSADDEFQYDGSEILFWLNHILEAERLSETFFQQYGIVPLRLSYERMFMRPTKNLLQEIVDFCGIGGYDTGFSIVSGLSKVATEKNRRFADRFYREYSDFLLKVAQERRPWLCKLS